jgi:GH25 family lysozyme M1 (1,4-beta-N-acetylmuramidase)
MTAHPFISQTTPGIDVSNWQGTVNWDAVYEAGYRFAMVKATQGVSFRDRFFQANWQNAKRARHVRLAYHFARPSENSPSNEANFFVEVVQPVLEPGDCVVLDMEDEQTQADVSQWTMRWLAQVTEDLGFLPLIYTGPWYLDSRLAQRPAAMGTYGLMLAAYQAAPPPPPYPWSSLALWQYSSTGSVPGVSGNCDLDEFFGTVEQLQAYGLPGVPPDHITDPGPPVITPPGLRYSVGSGLLDLMHANEDSPASDEGYPSEYWSEAYGQSGIRYVWWTKQNFGQMFVPAT